MEHEALLVCWWMAVFALAAGVEFTKYEGDESEQELKAMRGLCWCCLGISFLLGLIIIVSV